MKILFISTNIGYGGASKIIVNLANYLSKKNYEVTFLTYRDEKILQELHDKIHYEHKKLFQHPIKLIERIGQIVALHRFIKKGNFDIAISFLQPTNFMLVLAAKLTSTKVIISQRGDPFTKRGKMNLAIRLMEKITGFADAFVFQTKEAQNYYSKRIQNKSVVIANPVIKKNTIKRYNGLRNKEIVNVARLDIFQKRQDVLLKAFSKISPKYYEFVLKLYGDGPDEKILKNLAKELGIFHKVYFMGYVNDIENAIKKASVFVLSSDFEGIPNALIEAISIGVPCISTDCNPGGARLLIKNNENGLLVPVNSPNDLAKAIDYILSNPEDANRMANNALTICDEYNEEKIFSQWEKFINEVRNYY